MKQTLRQIPTFRRVQVSPGTAPLGRPIYLFRFLMNQKLLNRGVYCRLTQKTVRVPHSKGLELILSVRPISYRSGLPAGTQSASLFLVNKRSPSPETAKRDCAYIFQSQLTVTTKMPFVPRPDLRNQALDDEDERIADLQYRHDVEYVVGHNVSATATLCEAGAEDSNDHKDSCYEIYTNWMPQANVEKVVPAVVEGVNLEIEALGNADSAEAIRHMVGGMVTAYTAWIAQ